MRAYRTIRKTRASRSPAGIITGGGSLVPSWVLSGAAVDMNFATGQYYGGTLASLLSITRASNKTDLLPSSASGFAYSTFGNNVLAITPTLGLLIEEARTNQLLNSAVPATQTTGSLGTGTYTLWVNGSGSALASAGTATITGAASASNGSPNTITVTVAGTVTVTVTGSLNFFQLEAGTFGTSGIVTAGATATRAADNVAATGALLAIFAAAQGSVVVATGSKITVTSVWLDRDFSNNVILQAQAGTTARQLANGTSIVSSLGSGNWTTGAGKAVSTWSAAAGGSAGANNGTVATNAAIFAGSATSPKIGSYGASSQFVNGSLARITAFTIKLPDATAKAFTV